MIWSASSESTADSRGTEGAKEGERGPDDCADGVVEEDEGGGLMKGLFMMRRGELRGGWVEEDELVVSGATRNGGWRWTGVCGQGRGEGRGRRAHHSGEMSSGVAAREGSSE